MHHGCFRSFYGKRSFVGADGGKEGGRGCISPQVCTRNGREREKITTWADWGEKERKERRGRIGERKGEKNGCIHGERKNEVGEKERGGRERTRWERKREKNGCIGERKNEVGRYISLSGIIWKGGDWFPRQFGVGLLFDSHSLVVLLTTTPPSRTNSSIASFRLLAQDRT